MDAQISLTLDGPLRDFVEAQVASGRHGRPDEVLRAALVEGEESGPPAPFDIEDFIAEKLGAPAPPP